MKNKYHFVALLFTFAYMGIHAQVVMDPDLLDFGDVKETEQPVRCTKVWNRGKYPVRLVEVVRMCVCASPELKKDQLQPGESIDLNFELDPRILSGPFHKAFYLRTEDKGQSLVPIWVKGRSVPVWQVNPAKNIHLDSLAMQAIFHIKAEQGAPSINSVTVSGDSFHPVVSVYTNEADKLITVKATLSENLTPGFHSWQIDLNSVTKEIRPLSLRVSTERGRVWDCLPRRVRSFFSDKPIKLPVMISLRNCPDMRKELVSSTSIKISPSWKGLSIESNGEITAQGIPLLLTIPPEIFQAWGAPKVLYFTIPGKGTATLLIDVPFPTPR